MNDILDGERTLRPVARIDSAPPRRVGTGVGMVTLQRGDRVMFVGGGVWDVYAVALACFYVVVPDYPSCPPRKADYALLTHVWRNETWVAWPTEKAE